MHIYKCVHAVGQCDSCNVCTHAPSREGEESPNSIYIASRKVCCTILRQCSVKIRRRSLTYLILDIEKQYIYTSFSVIAVNNETRPIVYSETATFVLLIKWCKMNGFEVNI